MDRFEAGMWTCIGCKQILPIPEFGVWLAPRADKKKVPTARCNSFKDKDEKERQRLRLASTAMVMTNQLQAASSTASPNSCTSTNAQQLVQICCSTCHTSKEVSIDTFWQRHDGNRFSSTRCKQCSSNTRIGKWLRCQDGNVITILQWLEYNKCCKAERRPENVTAALFMVKAVHVVQAESTQTTSSLLQHTNTETKRQRPDSKEADTKRQRKSYMFLHDTPLQDDTYNASPHDTVQRIIPRHDPTNQPTTRSNKSGHVTNRQNKNTKLTHKARLSRKDTHKHNRTRLSFGGYPLWGGGPLPPEGGKGEEVQRGGCPSTSHRGSFYQKSPTRWETKCPPRSGVWYGFRKDTSARCEGVFAASIGGKGRETESPGIGLRDRCLVVIPAR